MQNEPSIESCQLLIKGLDLLDEGPEGQKKAREYIVKAAEMNHPDALYFAYSMLSRGEGGAFDRSRAFDFLVRAAELDHTESIYSLGYCYLSGGMGNVGYSNEILNQKKVPQDIERALALLEKAANLGHGLAVCRIAEHWENESEEDASLFSKAIDWYERGATLGEPNCLIHLADFLVIGRGSAPDKKQAKRLYKKAAKSDDVCASNIAQQRLDCFDELESILKNER